MLIPTSVQGQYAHLPFSLPSPSQMHLALYCFANGQLSTALRLLYRARYLMLVVSGEDHPEMALLDVSEIFARLVIFLKSFLFSLVRSL